MIYNISMHFCVQVKVTNILSAIDAAEYLITHNASHVVKQVQIYQKYIFKFQFV